MINCLFSLSFFLFPLYTRSCLPGEWPPSRQHLLREREPSHDLAVADPQHCNTIPRDPARRPVLLRTSNRFCKSTEKKRKFFDKEWQLTRGFFYNIIFHAFIFVYHDKKYIWWCVCRKSQPRWRAKKQSRRNWGLWECCSISPSPARNLIWWARFTYTFAHRHAPISKYIHTRTYKQIHSHTYL